MFPGNLRGEYQDFIEKFGGLPWKNESLVETPYIDGSPSKISKYQTEVDTNPCWLVLVSFLYDNLYWNK